MRGSHACWLLGGSRARAVYRILFDVPPKQNYLFGVPPKKLPVSEKHKKELR